MNPQSDRQTGFSQRMETAIFRANPNYELLLFDRLPEHQREMLADLQKQAEFYGILRPVEQSGLGIKSVSRDTALLFLTLREPGPLPAYARALAGKDFEKVLSRLLLDNILEVQSGDEFVSGATAFPLLHGEQKTVTTKADGEIGRLSADALKYGQALAVEDMMELSMRLYSYHRVPASPRWKRLFPTSEKVAEHLGIDRYGRHRRLLDEFWQESKPRGDGAPETQAGLEDGTPGGGPALTPPLTEREDSDGWFAWHTRQVRLTPRQSAFTYKLYISPRPEVIKEAFDTTLTTLSTSQANHFKVGADVYGLLRPDKMVAYFWNFTDLQAASESLAQKLSGCPAHGVPFTAEIAGGGLLSWGVDPPDSQQLLSWQPRESWRLWLTNRLANALLAAKKMPRAANLEPWQFALERLRLEGVDTDTWIPSQQIWQR